MPTYRLTQTVVILEKRAYNVVAADEAEAHDKVKTGAVQGTLLGTRAVVLAGEPEAE